MWDPDLETRQVQGGLRPEPIPAILADCETARLRDGGYSLRSTRPTELRCYKKFCCKQFLVRRDGILNSDPLWQMKPYKNMVFETEKNFNVNAAVTDTWAAVTNMMQISGHATGTWMIPALPEDPKPGRMMYGELMNGTKIAGMIIEYEPLRRFVFDRAKRRFEFDLQEISREESAVSFRVYSVRNPNFFPWSRWLWDKRPPENVSSICSAIKYAAEKKQ